VVHETGNVSQLTIENLSPTEEVYIQSGDIVKGGRQDRALPCDLILKPQSGKVPLPSFCVEHGRWQRRGTESDVAFGSSSDTLHSKDLKLAAKYRKSQAAVWEEVYLAQETLTDCLATPVQAEESSTSLQLSLEHASVRESAEPYVGALLQVIEGKDDVIGYAFAVNGKVNSADVYASRALFRKLWPRLLKANAVEALAGRRTDSDSEPMSAEAVREWLAEAEEGSSAEDAVSEQMRVTRVENESTVLYDTCDRQQEDRIVHRNCLAKQVQR
jgi:hypothetical protein